MGPVRMGRDPGGVGAHTTWSGDRLTLRRPIHFPQYSTRAEPIQLNVARAF